jgi:hypothetical protein
MKLTGNELKEHGLDLVTDHNEDFVFLARREGYRIAYAVGEVSADDVREWTDAQGIYPEHQNAWGAVFRTGFERVGYRPSRTVSSHGRVIAVWRLSE